MSLVSYNGRFCSATTHQSYHDFQEHTNQERQYPLPGGYSSWAITSPDSEAAEESWSDYSTKELPDQRKALLQELDSWCTPVKELIEGAERLMKYGLYDRRELTSNQWYDGRSVLIGDAAHPTSPHLGQGANQAMSIVAPKAGSC